MGVDTAPPPPAIFTPPSSSTQLDLTLLHLPQPQLPSSNMAQGLPHHPIPAFLFSVGGTRSTYGGSSLFFSAQEGTTPSSKCTPLVFMEVCWQNREAIQSCPPLRQASLWVAHGVDPIPWDTTVMALNQSWGEASNRAPQHPFPPHLGPTGAGNSLFFLIQPQEVQTSTGGHTGCIPPQDQMYTSDVSRYTFTCQGHYAQTP